MADKETYLYMYPINSWNLKVFNVEKTDKNDSN